MLTKPTPNQLTALANVAAQPIWRSVEDMLKTELVHTQDRLMVAAKADIGRLQGRAQVLTEFLSMTHKSPSTL